MSHIWDGNTWCLLHRPTVNHNQPPDKTLLEEEGLTEESIADQYHNAIHDFLSGRNTSKERLKFIMEQRNVIE